MHKFITTIIVFVILVGLLGCTTVKDSYVRSSDETVKVEYFVENGSTNCAFVIPIWVEEAAKQVGAWTLQEIAKKYIASWEATQVIPLIDTNGTVIPTKVYVKRYIHNVPVASIGFKFTPIFNQPSQKYFLLEEDRMQIWQTKAKTTAFLSSILHADELDMRIKIDMTAPNAAIQGGLNTYTWEIACAGVKPHWTNTTHRISVWEVPSHAPYMGIHISVVEENKMAGWLLQGADVLK